MTSSWNETDYHDKTLEDIINLSVKKGVFPKEINIEEFGYSGIIYPVPIPFEYVETSTLYHDLAELADFFWYESYQNKLIQE